MKVVDIHYKIQIKLYLGACPVRKTFFLNIFNISTSVPFTVHQTPLFNSVSAETMKKMP